MRRPTSPRQNKRAIDAVAKQLRPDYLMLLGSVDVIPHQDMRNPIPSDGDPTARGDLPYACEAPYSQTNRTPSADPRGRAAGGRGGRLRTLSCS